MLAADFGDAADAGGSPYTSASHEAIGPILGVLRDANSFITNSLANADAQDEDGVIFSFLRAGQPGSMTVYVTNAPAGARLDAWIDFGRNNNFTSAGDQIVDNLAVTNGDNVFTFNIPATVGGGHYYARVRLSTAGNLNPSGVAADGEVEDHLIAIAYADSGPFAGPQPLSFIDATQAVPADIDSDGDLDLVTTRLTWIENIDGRFGAEVPIASSAAATTIAPIDFDDDGDMDVVSNGIGLYENNGSQTFTFRTIHASVPSPIFHLVDLDDDSDLDIITRTANSDIRWSRRNADGSYTHIGLVGSPINVESIATADMDADGDLDILTASSSTAHGIKWLVNDGHENFTARQVWLTDSLVRKAMAADFDGDGDLDVISQSAGAIGVAWYENDGAETFTPRAIDPAQRAQSATVADLDGDGDLDVAIAGVSLVAWYENNGDEEFTYRDIATASGTHQGVTAADLDGDGRLDLVTAGTGLAPVAWYRQAAEYDYGDAPRPYRVYLQYNGARHIAVGPRLGVLRDAEADGAHAPAGAEAEDDGVTFGAFTAGQSFGTIAVKVQNAPAGARLDAWIDFNGDGTWSGAEEQVFRNVAVVEGDNALYFTIPSGAKPGVTYARFRLSTAGGLGVHGAAPDGEVEDHELTLPAGVPATGVFGAATSIGASAASFMTTADIDGDGDVDVVTTPDFNRGLTWHENLGAAGFAAHAIPDSTIRSEDFVADDLDDDGDMDIVGFGAAELVWMENDGQQNFTRRVQSSLQVPFTIVSPHALDIADFDGDGDRDVLASDLSSVYLLLNNGQQQFTVRHVGAAAGSASVVAADIDRDGDLDIVAAGVRNSSGSPSTNVIWYQNDGALTFTPRTVKARPSIPSSVPTETVAVGDIDGDGDLDVVAGGTPGSTPGATAPTLTWHEQVAGNQFVQHDIEVGGTVRWVELADFDADGDLDIVSAGWSSPTVVYENVGPARFIRRQLTPGPHGGSSVAAADMDGDGDLDVVDSGVFSGPGPVWFENLDIVDPDYGDAPAPYPTTRADSGPVHNGGGPRLGATRDSEADGAPTSAADGDVDDGVTLQSVQVGQGGGTVIVNVQNAAAGAKLDAWIDFSGDGSFDGAGEQLFASRTVGEGDNALTFSIPANTPAGAVAARFRISTAGGLRSTGVALDGEVEDYLLSIAPPEVATGEYGPRRGLGPRVDSIRIADIDGDGDADVLTVNQSFSPNLVWHENLGDGAFLRRSNGLTGPASLGARPVDFDRDGDVDIVITTASGGLAWYENNGAESFTFRNINGSPSGLRAVLDIADVDGDGDLDVIAARIGLATQQISILLNNGQQGFASAIPLTTPTLIPAAIRAADVDGDGDIDFAVAFDGNSSGWYENGGGAWTYRSITPAPGTEDDRLGHDIVPIDFDGDGDVDLVVLAYASSNVVLDLYRNDGAETFTRETLAAIPTPFVATSIVGGDRLQIADLDGDGDLDAVAGAYRGTHVYRNDGPGPFTQMLVVSAPAFSYYTPVAVADLDADGRLEILGSNGLSTGTYWLDDLHFGDYDRNGTVDQADRDLYDLTLGQPAVPPGAGADGNRSGTVDPADLAIWEANQGRGPAPFYQTADFDQNERIDGRDFLRWQQRFGTTPPFPGALVREDADLSGAVDAGDLVVWQRHFGQGVSGPRAQAVSSAFANAELLSALSSDFALAAGVILDPNSGSASPARSKHIPNPEPNYLAAQDAALASFQTRQPTLVSRTTGRSRPSSSESKTPDLPPSLVDDLLADPWHV